MTIPKDFSTAVRDIKLAILQARAKAARLANAEALKLGSIETAKESERGIVDIETLKATNQSLITTLDEVMKIQEDGRAKRRAAEQELQQIESELKQKLLSMRN